MLDDRGESSASPIAAGVRVHSFPESCLSWPCSALLRNEPSSGPVPSVKKSFPVTIIVHFRWVRQFKGPGFGYRPPSGSGQAQVSPWCVEGRGLELNSNGGTWTCHTTQEVEFFFLLLYYSSSSAPTVVEIHQKAEHQRSREEGGNTSGGAGRYSSVRCPGELLRYSTANLYYFFISRACSRVKDKIDRRLARLKGKN